MLTDDQLDRGFVIGDWAALPGQGILQSGENDIVRDMVDALTGAFEPDPERAIHGLQESVQKRLRWPLYFDGPVFTALRYEPRFVAVRREPEEVVAAAHNQVLQPICFTNPVPDEWRPIRETCEGAEERRP